ncbi:unnamed protein product [Sphenostylis stenocarpa]|uniref:HMG box domain-containing protein n=1 Tax=Sphenostylis stenocarpa TaxID=92480 RepID=A0AA86VK37_9FABA|nr:unnamed protein product [Sphenostylis stenocarpa]
MHSAEISKQPASSPNITHKGNTFYLNAIVRASYFTAHGSLTWRKIVEIPRKTPTSIFSRFDFQLRFLYTAPPHNPSYPLLSRPNLTTQCTLTFSLLSLKPLLLADFVRVFPLSLSFAMPKVKADSKAADNRLKRKGVGAGRKQTKKAAKDPNKPKRPPSAFFVFMSEFRELFKKDHPTNKSVAVVGKAGGDKWKSMSDAEKAPFIARAEKKKEEYEKSISAYNKKLEGKNSEEEESDKSKSEVNDEEEEEEDDEDDE